MAVSMAFEIVPPPANNILDLPNELLEEILELLLDTVDSAQSGRLSALGSVRLTCRRLRAVADSLVFKVLEIPGFSDIVEERPASAGPGGRQSPRRRPTVGDWLCSAASGAGGMVRELRFLDPSSLPSARPKNGCVKAPLPSLLPGVSSLDLSGLTSRSLTDESFATMLNHCASLQRLNLSCASELTDIALAGLVTHQQGQRASCLPVIKKLDLSFCNRISFAAIRKLIVVLGSNLRVLKLSAIPSFGAEDVLSDIVHCCPNIEELCLADSDLGPGRSHSSEQDDLPALWLQLGSRCTKLSSLNIAGCPRITPECLVGLGRGRSTALESGIQCACWTFLGLGRLGWKDLLTTPAADSDGIGSDGMGPVSPVVTLPAMRSLLPESEQTCSAVELSLDLSNLVLAVPVLHYLANHQDVSGRLVSLDLTSTSLFVPNVAFGELSSPSHVLSPILQKFNALKTLLLAQLVPPMTDDLLETIGQSCPRLGKLDMRGAFLVTDRGLSCLGDLRNLSEVDLKACEGLTDAGVLGLLDGRSAKSLNLGLVSGLSDAVLNQIDLSEIVTLKLSGCTMISDEGISAMVRGATGGSVATAFADDLDVLPASVLDKLHLLCFHNLRLLSPPALVSLFRIVPNLTSLNLYGCDLVTDEVLCGLGSYCQLLESLCVSGCGVSDVGMRGLIIGDRSKGQSKGCRRLRTLYAGFLVGSWNSDELAGACVDCDAGEDDVLPGDLDGMEIEDMDDSSEDDGSAFGDGDDADFEEWFQAKLSLDSSSRTENGVSFTTRPPLMVSPSEGGPSGSSSSENRFSSSFSRGAFPASFQSATSFASVSSTAPKSQGLTDRSVELALNKLAYLKILDVSGSDVTLDFPLEREPVLETLKVRCCRKVKTGPLERLVAACPELKEVETVGSGVDALGRARIAAILDERY